MFDTIINGAWATGRAILESGDHVTLLIAAGTALLASLKMDRLRQIVGATLGALTLFVICSYVYDYVGIAPLNDVTDGGRLLDQLRYSWNSFMDLGVGGLIFYVAAFVAAILVCFGVRSMLIRG